MKGYIYDSVNKTYYIYLLIDPITEDIRYVGVTSNRLSRLYGHVSSANRNKKTRWIEGLFHEHRKTPTMKIICTFHGDEKLAYEYESFLIEKLIKEGNDLLNKECKNVYNNG